MRMKYFKIILLALLAMLIGETSVALFLQIPSMRGQTLRILVAGDPFALALRRLKAEFELELGIRLVLEVVGYNDTRVLTLSNANDVVSNYDIVSFDVVWLGEYVANNVLLPLEPFATESPVLQMDDFLQSALDSSRWDGVLYGLPIQPHPELLWYRTDLFAAAGLDAPQTTDEVLNAARALHNPDVGLYGICWNAQRGDALAQQMAHFFAAFGQPILDTNDRPTLDTPQGLKAAQYALGLLAYSPPDILNMAWDERITRFANGSCAMTYGWGARVALAEAINPDIIPLTGFVAAPHAPDAPPVTPMGTWSLGIPSNIGERQEIAWWFLEWLSSPQQQRRLAQAGNAGFPRYTLADDLALTARYPHFPLIAALDRENRLASWMRPQIPQWNAMAEILGAVFSDMLRGELSAQQAVTLAQDQLETLLQHLRKQHVETVRCLAAGYHPCIN